MNELRDRMNRAAAEATDGVLLVPPELLTALAARRKTRRRAVAAVTAAIVLAGGGAVTWAAHDQGRVTVTTPAAEPSQAEGDVVLGARLYQSAGCGACHGGRGEGGIGPKIAGGQAALTFPSVADEVEWVKSGSGPFTGRHYGNPSRPGGQAGPARGTMPAFAASLTDGDIAAIVAYERTLP